VWGAMYLYLSDILKRANLDINNVMLIRHSINSSTEKGKQCRKCYKNVFIEEYEKVQNENFLKNTFNECEYILSFISDKKTTAKFIGCYKIGESEKAEKTIMPKHFPDEKMFNSLDLYFHLKKVDILSELCGRLIIDWDKSTISWKQLATNDKAIISYEYGF
jgi:hypothetical protein